LVAGTLKIIIFVTAYFEKGADSQLIKKIIFACQNHYGIKKIIKKMLIK